MLRISAAQYSPFCIYFHNFVLLHISVLLMSEAQSSAFFPHYLLKYYAEKLRNSACFAEILAKDFKEGNHFYHFSSVWYDPGLGIEPWTSCTRGWGQCSTSRPTLLVFWLNFQPLLTKYGCLFSTKAIGPPVQVAKIQTVYMVNILNNIMHKYRSIGQIVHIRSNIH